MAADQQQYFNPWDPPPFHVPPPGDAALEQRILKLADFAARNGPNFVELMKQKQAGNPEYHFLTGGEGSDFWRWTLHCKLYSQPAEHQPTHGTPVRLPQLAQQSPGLHYIQQPGGRTALPPQANLPSEVENGFNQVLAALNGSKESIKASREWFMACLPHAAGLAVRMALYLQQLPTYEQQLHLIYLANDILVKSVSHREAGVLPDTDTIACAFQPVMPNMLSSALAKGGGTPEVRERLESMVDFWADCNVFLPSTSEGLKKLLAAPPPQPAQHTGQPAQMPAPHLQPGTGGGPAAHPPYAAPGGFSGPAPQLGIHGASMPMFSQPAMQPAWGAPPSMPPGPGAYQQPNILQTAWPQHQPPMQYSGPPAQPQWGQPPMAQMPLPGGPGMAPQFAPPHHAHGLGVPGAAVWYPPPVASGAHFPAEAGQPFSAPPAAAPAAPAADPMGFPPGLIPQLVRAQADIEAPYAPLSMQSIEAAGLPAPAQPDAYLAARLDRFYAELRDYRAGMMRADVEDSQLPARTARQLGAQDTFGAGGTDDGGPPRSTGFSGPDRGKAAGLGFGAESATQHGLGAGSSSAGSSGLEDVYDSYRKTRSGAYREVLARSAAANMIQQQAVR